MVEATQPYAPLVEVTRSGFVESTHYGAVVGLSAVGEVRYQRGDIARPMLPRSAAKPFQALASLRQGATLDPPRLAIAAGSHSGTEEHVGHVLRILSGAGLEVDDLQCPAAWPGDRAVRERLLVRGDDGRSRERMNCSGKHAAMLAACVASGWTTKDYLEPGHPLQRRIRATIEELSEEPVTHTTVDGCGAPQMAVSLLGLAWGVWKMVHTSPHTPEGLPSPESQVLEAMRAHPENVAGPGKADTRVMERWVGSVSKIGAEGVAILASPTGEVVAVKIGDGDPTGRARTIAALGAMSTLTDITPVETMLTTEVDGGEVPVGEIRPIR